MNENKYQELYEKLLLMYEDLLKRFEETQKELKKMKKTKKKKYVPETQYSKEWFSKKEIKQLFNYPGLKTRDRLLYQVTYYGGLRISEALNSKREDYRQDDYSYLVLRKQKTDKKNWAASIITDPVYAEVIRYCNDNDIKTQDHVFQSNRKERLDYGTVYKNLKKICKECNINKAITTHSFRRSRATHLLDNGLSLNRVSQFLRHKSLKTTEVYLKLSQKSLAEDIAKIDDEIFEQI